MANLELLADEFRKEGYSDQNAEAFRRRPAVSGRENIRFMFSTA